MDVSEFRSAIKKTKMRFLKLAFDKKIRSEIVHGHMTTSFIEGPAHEILLADPASNAFLGRLDAERKDNWDIWRVRYDVHRLVGVFNNINQHREEQTPKKEPLLVGFHQTELFCSLTIQPELCEIKFYPSNKSWHDSTEPCTEVAKSANANTRCKFDAFARYFDFVQKNTTTVFISNFDTTSAEWPTLFKSNVSRADGNHYYKLIENSNAMEAEKGWLEPQAGWRSKCVHFFRPVKSVPLISDDKEFGYEKLAMEKVHDAMTVDELLWCLRQLYEDQTTEPYRKSKIRQIASLLVCQGLMSVSRFQALARDFTGNDELAGYDWCAKIKSAIDEVSSDLCPDRNLIAGCKKELLQIAARIKPRNNVTFRDAHLKNRLVANVGGHFQDPWAGDKDKKPRDVPTLRDALKERKRFLLRTATKWLDRVSVKNTRELAEHLDEHTFDIDFESTTCLTNEWDDVLHVLSCPHIGHLPKVDQVQECWSGRSVPTEADLIRQSFLLRAFREFCRRLFYRETMPTAFHRRYGLEPDWFHLKCLMDLCGTYPNLSKTRTLLQSFTERKAIPPEQTNSTEPAFVVLPKMVDLAKLEIKFIIEGENGGRQIEVNGEPIKNLPPGHYNLFKYLWEKKCTSEGKAERWSEINENAHVGGQKTAQRINPRLEAAANENYALPRFSVIQTDKRYWLAIKHDPYDALVNELIKLEEESVPG